MAGARRIQKLVDVAKSRGSAGARGSFPLVIVTAFDRLPRPEQAGALAALMQGGSFLIAAFGPFAMALLHGWSESFGSGAVMHLACIAVIALLYAGFDRPLRGRDEGG